MGDGISERTRAPKRRAMSRATKVKLWGSLTFVVIAAVFLATTYAIGQARDARAAAEYTPRPVVSPSPSPTPTPTAAPAVLFFGDSFTAGAKSSSPDRAWVSIVSSKLGWDATNNGRGGTAFGAGVSGKLAPEACGLDYCPSFLEMAETSTAVKPSIIIVSGGQNQRSNRRADSDAAVRAFFDAIARDYPDAKVYATNVLWRDANPPAALGEISNAVKDNVTRIGGTYLDLGQPLTAATMLAPDDAHPNDDGHRAIADAFISAFG